MEEAPSMPKAIESHWVSAPRRRQWNLVACRAASNDFCDNRQNTYHSERQPFLTSDQVANLVRETSGEKSQTHKICPVSAASAQLGACFSSYKLYKTHKTQNTTGGGTRHELNIQLCIYFNHWESRLESDPTFPRVSKLLQQQGDWMKENINEAKNNSRSGKDLKQV